MKRPLRPPVYAALTLLCALSVAAFAARMRDWRPPRTLPNITMERGRVTLPNGWRITPAGRSIPLPGDMPLKMIVSPDGRTLLVNTGGFHDHSVSVIDIRTEKSVQSLDVYNTWAGLCLDGAGAHAFLSGGGASSGDYQAELRKKGVSPESAAALVKPIYRLSLENGAMKLDGGIDIEALKGNSRFIAGLAMGPDQALYAVNINTDTVYRLTGTPRRVEAHAKVGYRPYAVALSPDAKTLAVSNWGDQSVSLLDPATLRERARVKVGSHPNELAYGPNGRLFVAESGSNSVSVLRNAEVVETIVTSIDPKAPLGSTPDALAISPDGRRLFVANADNNDVAVVDIAPGKQGEPRESRVLGFIPTGWYPSALAISRDGKKLFVGTGKGLRFWNNFPARIKEPAEDYNGRTKYDYIGDALSGAVSFVDIPDAKRLAEYTRQVRANLPLPVTASVGKAQIEDVTRRVFPNIKHVLFIIRENRTYDQVFGDIPTGNGAPNLTLFGERITPNAHALARSMVLLDNLYCNGEVSEDGHEWCNAAYATDNREKGWVLSYNGRREPDVDARLNESPGGYLWDNCARHNVTYRSYGEFAGFKSSPTSRPVYTGNPTLNGHACVEWSLLDRRKAARDMDFADVFIQELHEGEKTGNWPQYMVMSLGEDHTRGLRPGEFTPFSCVAANDWGLGKIVEAVSRSRFWKETAIFVIEDDAQDGPDHVDAHRTVGLVISPYVRRGAVDSTFYTTVSMVRTIELILNLPPMTQFDASATPLYSAFTSRPDLSPYTAFPARINLAERNPKEGKAAKLSALLDFSQYDRADPAILNRLLWEYAKPGVPMPAPVRSFH